MRPTWESGGIQLYLADCLDVLPTLEAGSVDAVVTDPPYGLLFPYSSYDDTRANLDSLLDRTIPLLIYNGWRVVILPGITQVSLYPNPTWIGCVTWNTTGSFGKYGYSQWMPVLLYGKDIAGFGNVNGGILKSDTIKISGGGGVGFMRNGEKDLHPCPKPLNVMVHLVQRYTEPSTTILDPFMGSGTTGVACVQTGRKFIGIEIDAGYFEIAKQRIEAAQNEMIQETFI